MIATVNRCVPIVATMLWLLFIGTLAFSWVRPAYSFDALYYGGLTKAERFRDDAELYRIAYPTFEQHVSGSDSYIGNNDYRQMVRRNPAMFAHEAGYYRIKVGYIFAARMLRPWTPDAFLALRLTTLLGLAMLAMFVPLCFDRQVAALPIVAAVLSAGVLMRP